MRTFSIGQTITTAASAIILLAAAVPAFAQNITLAEGQISSSVAFGDQPLLNTDYAAEYNPPTYQVEGNALNMGEIALPMGSNFVVDAVELVSCMEEADGTPVCTWVVRVFNFGLDNAPASTINILREGTWENHFSELPMIPGFGTAYSNQFTTRGYDPYIEVWFDIHSTVAESVEDDNIAGMTLHVP